MKITKSEVRQLLAENDGAVIKALLRLANQQRSDERQNRVTIHKNKRGFRKQHGSLVVYAERIKAGKHLDKDCINWLRYRLMAYAGQLAQHVNEFNLTLPGMERFTNKEFELN